MLLPDTTEWYSGRNIICITGCRAGAPLQQTFSILADGRMDKNVSSALSFLDIPMIGADFGNASDV